MDFVFHTAKALKWRFWTGLYAIVFLLRPHFLSAQSAPTAEQVVTFYGTNGFLWDHLPPSHLDCSLASAADGNFYGVTVLGGPTYTGGPGPPANTFGTIFKLGPDGSLTTLAVFTPNIFHPEGNLLVASDGNFYGSAAGGDFYQGAIYRASLAGVLTNVFSFSGSNGFGANELVQARDGDLYGTTTFDSPSLPQLGFGTIFKVTTNGVLNLLFRFDGTNGCRPAAGLVEGPNGSLYGTTEAGGNGFNGSYGGWGTVFKITPDGGFSTLFAFDGTNGASPQAKLLVATDGYLYGTTYGGGSDNLGTVFKLSTSGELMRVVSFNGTNGHTPMAALIQATDGNLYGTTSLGGRVNAGTIFQLTPDGVLKSLWDLTGFEGGQYPGRLVQGPDGSLYCITAAGGRPMDGNIVRLKVPMTPSFRAVRLTDTGVALVWNAVTGEKCQLQYATNFDLPKWIDIGTPLTATNGLVTSIDTVSKTPPSCRFYRLTLLP